MDRQHAMQIWERLFGDKETAYDFASHPMKKEDFQNENSYYSWDIDEKKPYLNREDNFFPCSLNTIRFRQGKPSFKVGNNLFEVRKGKKYGTFAIYDITDRNNPINMEPTIENQDPDYNRARFHSIAVSNKGNHSFHIQSASEIKQRVYSEKIDAMEDPNAIYQPDDEQEENVSLSNLLDGLDEVEKDSINDIDDDEPIVIDRETQKPIQEASNIEENVIESKETEDTIKDDKIAEEKNEFNEEEALKNLSSVNHLQIEQEETNIENAEQPIKEKEEIIEEIKENDNFDSSLLLTIQNLKEKLEQAEIENIKLNDEISLLKEENVSKQNEILSANESLKQRINELEEEKKSVQNELEMSKESNLEISSQLNDYQNKTYINEDEFKSLKDSNDSLLNEKKILEENVTSLQEEKKTLNEELNAIKYENETLKNQSLSFTSLQETSNNQLKEKDELLIDLQNKIEELNQFNSSLSNQITDLENEKNVLNETVSSLKMNNEEKENSSLQKDETINSLNENNENLKKELENIKEENKELENEISSLNIKYEEIKTNYDSLDEQSRMTSEQLETLNSEYVNISNEKENIKNLYDELFNKNENLNLELNENLNNIESLKNEIEEKDKEIENIKSENTSLKEKNIEDENVKTEMIKLQSDNEIIKQENEQLKIYNKNIQEKNASLQNEINECNENYSQLKASNESNINSKNEEITSLQKENDENIRKILFLSLLGKEEYYSSLLSYLEENNLPYNQEEIEKAFLLHKEWKQHEERKLKSFSGASTLVLDEKEDDLESEIKRKEKAYEYYDKKFKLEKTKVADFSGRYILLNNYGLKDDEFGWDYILLDDNKEDEFDNVIIANYATLKDIKKDEIFVTNGHRFEIVSIDGKKKVSSSDFIADPNDFSEAIRVTRNNRNQKTPLIYIYIKVLGINANEPDREALMEFFDLMDRTAKRCCPSSFIELKNSIAGRFGSFAFITFDGSNTEAYKEVLDYAILLNSYRKEYKTQQKLDAVIVLNELQVTFSNRHLDFEMLINETKDLELRVLKYEFNMSVINSTIKRALHLGPSIISHLGIDQNYMKPSFIGKGDFMKMYKFDKEFKTYNVVYNLTSKEENI